MNEQKARIDFDNLPSFASSRENLFLVRSSRFVFSRAFSRDYFETRKTVCPSTAAEGIKRIQEEHLTTIVIAWESVTK